MVERLEAEIASRSNEVREDFVNPVSGLGSADCGFDAEAGVIQKKSDDLGGDVAGATEDDGRDVFRHEFLG